MDIEVGVVLSSRLAELADLKQVSAGWIGLAAEYGDANFSLASIHALFEPHGSIFGVVVQADVERPACDNLMHGCKYHSCTTLEG